MEKVMAKLMTKESALKDVNDEGQITSNSSSHPLGTTLGTLGGAAVGVAGAVVSGAMAGTMVGAAGGALGAAVGGVIGAMTGHEIAAQVNPQAEDLYWRTNYTARPYVRPGVEYDVYEPAYRYGLDAFGRYKGRDFTAIESELGQDWNNVRGTSTLEWEEARHAARDAFDRAGQPKE
jgi:hypothetical protein